ncbi:MAG: putative porin [Paludibacter sp.]|nr:putative porin [Paludibacter sp.]
MNFGVMLCGQNNKVTLSVKSWKYNDTEARNDSVAPDTVHINFQDINNVDSWSIANSFNGNLGSPLQSKLYIARQAVGDFIFTAPYYPYLDIIDNHKFYNTHTPFSSLKYLSGGTLYHRENEISFLFAANVNKKLNFGTTLDYLYSTGEYARQGTKRFTATFFGTYQGERYNATMLVAHNNLNNKENGGLVDAKYLIDPLHGYYPEKFPIRINSDAQSTYNHLQFFYAHQYSLGIMRQKRDTTDSVKFEFVPVTKFGHTLKIDNMSKRYFENTPVAGFYRQTIDPYLSKGDTAGLLNISNKISIRLAEEYNRFMKFGFAVYAENEIQRFTFRERDVLAFTDTTMYRDTVSNPLKSNTKIGAILSKEQGQGFTYQILGEIALLGYKLGDFRLNADLASRFRVWRDTISLQANGFIRSDEPSLFLQRYISNHFSWENNFSKIYRTNIGGTFSIPTRLFSAAVSIENVSNSVYFDSLALPVQHNGNVQILSFDLKQDFHLWKFALENNIVYQVSSNSEVMPLPTLALYHNLYFHDKWFKVLSVQVGVDLRYHTAYYVPEYMPATGQFFNQQEMKVGNYPVMNVYANLHLKRVRFFVKYYHINQLFMEGVYYSMPHYPIAPAILKMGLTWNFYD